MSQLTVLSLDRTPVRDLTPLGELKKLSRVYIDENQDIRTPDRLKKAITRVPPNLGAF
jgi:Leucine-rich repeat (LRR) protein